MEETETDVLIVGAGPTGLTMALELSLHGIPFRIIDSTPTRSLKSKALVLQPRSLELLSRHSSSSSHPKIHSENSSQSSGSSLDQNQSSDDDIISKLTSKGNLNTALRVYAHKKLVFTLETRATVYQDSMFPNPLMVSQADTETILTDTLSSQYGVEVERSVTASSLSQDSSYVTVSLRKPDGSEETIKAKYVVGCDGSHSFVRRTAGIPFEGAVYPQDCILLDVPLKWSLQTNLSLFTGSRSFLAIFPMGSDQYRIICTRPYDPEASFKDSEAKLPTVEEFKLKVDELVPGEVEMGEPVWLTRFRLHHRIAGSFRERRVFLAGDAAHIHSPAGGQGMNTGIQDSINLAWKLTSVLKSGNHLSSERSEELLDSYHEERHRVAQTLLKGTDRIFDFMATTHPLLLFLRNFILIYIAPWVMSDPTRRANRFRFISQLGIRYRKSAITGEASSWTGKLKGGDRVPDQKLKSEDGETTIYGLCKGPTFHLLLFSGVGQQAADSQALKFASQEFLSEGTAGMEVKIHKIVTSRYTDTEADGERGVANQKEAIYEDLDGEAHGLYGLKGPAYILVRPDAYISFIGSLDTIAELEQWVKR